MTDKINIDKEIPIPVFPKKRGGKPPVYPFNEMEVGDSFRVPDDKEDSVRVAARRINRKTQKEFRALYTEDEIRIWRVK
ncbi:MAG: hypothetical protein IAE63_00045 [Alphaproteobacteria bacterium]|nr:hypothetical protein [Alphaproteobacteria bacterium]